MNQTHVLRPVPLALLIAVLVASLSGCVTDNRLSGSSEAGFLASSKALATLSPDDRKRFDAATARFVAVYYADTRPADAPQVLPDPSAVHRMTAQQFVWFVEHALAGPRPTPAVSPIFPNPHLAEQLLQQHEYERLLLTEARNRIIENGRNTVDQYPVEQAMLIPPEDDLPVTLDKARIVVHLRNDSDFDAYDPQFYLAILRGEETIYESIVRPDKGKTKREPIGPGVVTEYEFKCCDVIADPVRNADLKLRQEELDLDVSLVAVRDHRNNDILSLDGYTRFDVAKLPRIDACIAELRRAPATWVPRSVEQGGDPCVGTSVESRSHAAVEAIVEHAETSRDGEEL